MIEVSEFAIGQQISSTVEFRNVTSGSLVDPTTITWKVRTPAGIETSYVYGVASEVTKTGTGIYVGTIRVQEFGLYASRWNGTGAVVASDEEHFRGARSSLDAPI